MAELTNEQIDEVFDNCRRSVEDLARSISSSLSIDCRLTFGDEARGADEVLNRAPDGPGIALTLKLDGYGILCLIPESLPIPAWHHSPDDNQAARLEALVSEWKECLLPGADLPVQTRPFSCQNLRAHLESCKPTEDVRMLELSAIVSDADDSPVPIHMVLPVSNPILERRAGEAGDDADSVVVDEPASANEDSAKAMAPAATVEADRESVDPALEMRKRRINKVAVDLSVRIADRMMDIQQLRSIAPGTLLMFDKPFDSLLDVYIGNKLYCRGEAVKVGERFGIKINECNSEVVRVKKVRQV